MCYYRILWPAIFFKNWNLHSGSSVLFKIPQICLVPLQHPDSLMMLPCLECPSFSSLPFLDSLQLSVPCFLLFASTKPPPIRINQYQLWIIYPFNFTWYIMIILLCISGMDKNKGVGKRQICDSSSATYSLRNLGLFSSPPKSQFFVCKIWIIIESTT